MQSAKQLAFLLFGLNLVFACAGAVWLYVLCGNIVDHQLVLTTFSKAIADSKNIAALKAACLSLTDVTEEERRSRANFVIGSGAMVIGPGLLCSIVSIRLLAVLNRIEASDTDLRVT